MRYSSPGQDHPLYTRDGRIPHDLVGPLPVIEVASESFSFDEETRGAEDEERVVNRIVRRFWLVLPMNLLEILHVPAQGAKQRFDENRLRILLTKRLIAIASNSLPHLGQDFVQIAHGPEWLPVKVHSVNNLWLT